MAIATSDSTNDPPLDQNSVDDVNKKMNNIIDSKVSKVDTEENGENTLSSSAMTQIDGSVGQSDSSNENVHENGCESNGSGSGENDLLEAKPTDHGLVEDAKITDANINFQANGIEINTSDGFPKEGNVLENEDGGDCGPTGSGDSSNYSESVSSPAANESAVLQGDDTSGEKLSRTNLYIRGLGEDCNDKKLFDLCKKFGQIVSTKAIMHKQSMICKGYGFVDFSTEEEARRAVVELQNQGIPAQMARQQEQDLTNIYISNLPKNFDEKKLETVFQKFGTVVSTRILRDQNGVTKRVGFVRMDSQEMCESVIAKVHNKPLEDYPDCKLLCKFADAGKRRKPFYNTGSVPGAGVYDHFDHTYHQHNHHHSYNYSNHHHQSAYNSSLYANFPKGYNNLPGHSAGPVAAGAGGVSSHAANITLNGMWPSSAAATNVAAANFGGAAGSLNAMASTSPFANYYNFLLANPNAAAAAALSLGAVTNNAAAGSAAVLAGTGPLSAAASLGGAPFFQNPAAAVAAAAANQLASPAAANSAAGNHTTIINSPNSSASYLNNSQSSQHSDASTMQTSSHLNNQQQQSSASAVNGAGALVGGANVGGSSVATAHGQGTSAAELAAFYQQQSAAAAAAAHQNPHFLSNLSHTMHHMSLHQQSRGSAASHQNNSASNSASAAANNLVNNRTVTSASLFNNGPAGATAASGGLQAMLQHANSSAGSPLDAANQSSSAEDAAQRAAQQQQYTLNGAAANSAVNTGAYAGAHIQMTTPSAVTSQQQQQTSQQQQNTYWAMLPPNAAAQHHAAAAHYHAAMIQAQQQSTNDNPAANSAAAQTGSSVAGGNAAGNMHLFAYNRGAAATNVNNAQVQF